MIKIVLATSKEEIAKCHELRKQVFVKEQGVDIKFEIDQHERVCDHFLVYCDDLPAAVGRTRIVAKKVKFERIATLAEFRGRGLAKQLLCFMLGFVASKFPDHQPTLYSQIQVVSFYQKLGWHAVGDVFVQSKMEHREMVYCV